MKKVSSSLFLAALLAAVFHVSPVLACGPVQYSEECDTFVDLDQNARTAHLLRRLYPSEYDKYLKESAQSYEYGDKLWSRYFEEVKTLLTKAGQEKTPIELGKYNVYYYGTEQCHSNTPNAVLEFANLVYDNAGARKNLAELIKTRHDLMGLCTYGGGKDAPETKKLLADIRRLEGTGEISDYAAYLEGAYHFYMNDHKEARRVFESLASRAKDVKIKEISSYMVGRTLMNEAQARWSGWDEMDKIDRNSIMLAEKAFDDYLKRYPKGIYARSASDIKRRLFFLSGRSEELDRGIVAGFDERLDKGDFNYLFEYSAPEVDLFFGNGRSGPAFFPWDSPVIATAMLFKLESLPSDADKELEKRRVKFEKYPGLYGLAKARVLFLGARYEDILKKFPPEGANYGSFDSEIRVIQAMSLEKTGKMKMSRQLLEKLGSDGDYRYLAQALLFKSYLSANQAWELLRGEPFELYKKMIYTTLVEMFTDEELFKAATDKKMRPEIREMASEVLLTRYLINGRYKDLADAYKPLGEPKKFEGVITAAKTLSVNDKDPKALLNYGYFLQYNNITPQIYVYDYFYCNPKELRGFRGKIKGSDKMRDPLSYYLRALNAFKPDDRDELEAKVLYHAIHCFERFEGGRPNCSWEQFGRVDEKVRKDWFTRLKAKYKGTTWAEKTKYYW